MKLNLPILPSFNAGYVDTAGFLALQGLFTAHVTGNFVTFGASMALGTSGALAKLLALPVFCTAAILVRLPASGDDHPGDNTVGTFNPLWFADGIRMVRAIVSIGDRRQGKGFHTCRSGNER